MNISADPFMGFKSEYRVVCDRFSPRECLVYDDIHEALDRADYLNEIHDAAVCEHRIEIRAVSAWQQLQLEGV